MADDVADGEHMEKNILLVSQQSTAVNNGEGLQGRFAHLQKSLQPHLKAPSDYKKKEQLLQAVKIYISFTKFEDLEVCSTKCMGAIERLPTFPFTCNTNFGELLRALALLNTPLVSERDIYE